MKWHETQSPYRDPHSRGTGSTVIDHPAGFKIRTRGDTTGTVEHDYECPVHGRFRRDVPRVSVPDHVACEIVLASAPEIGDIHCGNRSVWCAPMFGVGLEPGAVRG